MSLLVSTVRVLMVDDHPVVREGLRSVLSADPELELVGEASSGRDALDLLDEVKPDVVLLDVALPGLSGLDVLREIKARRPEIAVVILTMYDSEIYFIEAMRSGAQGYLLKDAPQELICLAIRAAAVGGSLVQPRLLDVAIRSAETVFRKSTDPSLEKITSQLTPRELDVLRLLARGYQNRAISETLHLAEVTVKKYVQSVVAKVGVPDRTRAALLGARLGLAD